MSKDQIWAEENYQKDMIIKFLCRKRLFSAQSMYQKIEIYDTSCFGRILLNDNIVMITEKDEFVYHEMISHVPLFIHPHPQNILIIGGGDGGTAREILKHDSIKICKMVEIDSMVIEACKKYIPQTAQSFSHPKLDVIIEDGVQFVKESSIQFDVIIVDSTDPIGPAVPLFGEKFYQDIFKILTNEGIVIAQCESPFYNLKTQKKLTQITQSLFPIVSLYHYGNMSYPGGLWSFILASKKYHPLKDFQSQKVDQSKISFKYYNSSIHKASFAHPSFLKKEIPL